MSFCGVFSPDVNMDVPFTPSQLYQGVSNWVTDERVALEPSCNLEAFHDLFPFFLSDPQLVQMPMEQLAVRWNSLLSEGGELFEVAGTSLQLVLDSPVLIDEDKTAFLGKSVQDIVSDPVLLYSLLKTEYDRNLVIVCSGIEEGPKRRSLRTAIR